MQVIILGRRDLERVLDLPGVIEGVREAYRLKAAGETAVWPLVAHHFEEQKAVIAQAKALLMERSRMSEEEAHRYLQKSSMDSGTNMLETAQMVLTIMSDTV